MDQRIFDLGKRANINIYSFHDKPIFIYEDHRYILNILFYLRNCGLTHEPLDLVYFDYHEDFCSPSQSVQNIASGFDPSTFNIREFFSITEFELSTNDDDWLLAGMDFGLINDAVIIGAQENTGSNNLEVYSDVNGNDHNYYRIDHLSQSLSTRGCLGDTIIKDPFYNQIRSFFNYNWSSGYQGKSNSFIIDFDLDYFSERFKEHRFAWPKTVFKDEFFNPVGHQFQYTPYHFFEDLHKDSFGITICKESKCCGGIGEANRILEYLDEKIFKHSLGTQYIT